MGQVMKRKIQVMRWMIWSIAVFYYFYEYIIRVMPSVMSKELMASFDVDAAGFGSLSAAYMYAYAPMQIPVGMLMDRYGARRLLTIGAFMCAIGSFLFAGTPIFFLAQLGRFFTGLGSAFAFVGFVYVCNHWFQGVGIALIVGLGNSLGMLGAVIGQGPLSYVVNHIGWRSTSTIIGFIGLALAATILLLVRNEPKGMQKHEKKPSLKDVIANMKGVIAYKQTWIVALICMTAYLPTVTFAGLWCVPYIQDLYNVDNTTAGYASSMIFIGWLLGGPMLGHYSDLIKKRKPFYVVNSVLLFILFVIIVFYPPPKVYEMFLLLILLGVLASVQLLTYSTVVEINNPEAKGSAVAFTNFVAFIGACVTQPLVGWLLDLHWNGVERGGVPVYTQENFMFALTLFPIAMIFTFIFSLMLKEEHQSDVSDFVAG